MSSSPLLDAPSPGPQPAAVQAHLRRLARAPQAPWLHGEVARRMAQRLPFITLTPDVVVDWWAWHGGGEDALRAQYPAARIERVEPTAALVERSRRERQRPWWSPRLWRRPADPVWPLAGAPQDGRAQLLWSNMMLHWSADPAPQLVRWREAVAVGGFVMFSCFGPDTLRALRTLYERLGWGAATHAFIDMHDLGDAMVQAGFADPVMDMEQITLTWADAPAALRELRTLGGNAAAQRLGGWRTPRWRARMLAELEAALRGPDGRLRLGFEIVYGHAFRPAPRIPVASETRVAVDTLRELARSAGRPPSKA